MKDLKELVNWLKTEKGITVITMEGLLKYVPEFELLKMRN